MITMHVVASLA